MQDAQLHIAHIYRSVVFALQTGAHCKAYWAQLTDSASVSTQAKPNLRDTFSGRARQRAPLLSIRHQPCTVSLLGGQSEEGFVFGHRGYIAGMLTS